MVYTQGLSNFAGLLLLGAVPLALAHGDESNESGMDGMGAEMAHLTSASSVAALNSSTVDQQSYFTYQKHGGLMLAHIALMVVAWFFVLPIGEYIQILASSNCTLTLHRCSAQCRSFETCPHHSAIVPRPTQLGSVVGNCSQQQGSRPL